MPDHITHVWPKGIGPYCGNCSPITGECMIGCVDRFGGCIFSPEERQAASAERRKTFQSETVK